ncbi:MAG TPA: aldo/keto reductase [Caulobacteraceae bacterium]|jgi:aryl-alcohol dehydrogenase-like predicted oxidoreductase
MDHRPLGRSGLQIAPLMFGGNVFGWTADMATSHRMLDAFVDGGFNAVDTAEAYSSWVPGHSGGESETVIGEWLAARRRRHDVIIATKVGWHGGDATGLLSPSKISQAVEASLRRLKTDHIDLYQAHSDDLGTPQEETLAAFGRLIREGKVRAIGASNFSGERLASALAISEREGLPRYESLQPLYNLYDRERFEGELRPVCADHEVGVISYYGLAAGFLTGKYRSQADVAKSVRGPGSAGRYLNDRGLRILEALDSVSGRLGATQAQVALAWVMARPGVTAPIASATSVEQLRELMGAATLRLDQAAVAELEAASA